MNSILVIEDDVSYRNSIALILQMEGFDVRTADNGASGLVMVREKRPDLILCDIMMPGMDGHSVLEFLKSDSAIADIPFIFVTALAGRGDMRRGMSAGADDYLSKPFTADELLTAVAGRIRRYEMIAQLRGKSQLQKEQQLILQKITKREREILLMVGQGATSKEIAERLDVAPKTVEVHRANLMNKLDAANIATLTRWAVIAENS